MYLRLAPSIVPSHIFTPRQKTRSRSGLIRNVHETNHDKVRLKCDGAINTWRQPFLETLIQIHQGLVEGEAHQGFANQEGKEVPCGNMVAQTVALCSSRMAINIQFELHPGRLILLGTIRLQHPLVQHGNQGCRLCLLDQT